MANAIEIRNLILTSDLSVADLTVLKDALQVVRNRVAEETIASVYVGQRVKWVGRNKIEDFGTVTKINRKKCVVQADKDMIMWNIPASMLQAA
jgi:hypothetical protein